MSHRNLITLNTHPLVSKARSEGFLPLARAIQTASNGKIALTHGNIRIGDLKRLPQIPGINEGKLVAQLIKEPLRPGNYPIENLADFFDGKSLRLEEFYRSHLPFVMQDVVPNIESRQFKIFMLGGAGSGVVSAVQDTVSAFCSAGYFGRAFPLFDPSKKGAPVRGYGLVSRNQIFSHAPFENPDILVLFDQKIFPLLRQHLREFEGIDPKNTAVLVNSAMDPGQFRGNAAFNDPYQLYTLDATSLLSGKRIPPNYAMIGGMLGILGEEAVYRTAFAEVVQQNLTEKFGSGEKVDLNVDVLLKAPQLIKVEKGKIYTGGASSLGKIQKPEVPENHMILFEDGNRATARGIANVLNLFPSCVIAYPITPQTQIVEHLAQMIADGTLSSEGVTPGSEHEAGAAAIGAARGRVLVATATSAPGAALMSENLDAIAGMRMGNVTVSLVMRSLNSPLDVENDHSDLYKVLLDRGFLVFVSHNVQQAYDFSLMSYLTGMYAEYRNREDGMVEMIPDKAVMLPSVVASEGFEVSHAPERYTAASDELVKKMYADPAFKYMDIFVQPDKIIGTNNSIVGVLQLSNARFDTDYQRHLAMQTAEHVLENLIFPKFEEHIGRRYGFIDSFNNIKESEIHFVVAGAAYGTFVEVAKELKNHGINIAIHHPNIIRPFPKEKWRDAIKGKKVFVYDRDDAYGSPAGRLAAELNSVINEYDLSKDGTQTFSRIYGLGGRTPTLSLVRDEMYKTIQHVKGEIELNKEKQYVGVKI